MYSQIDCLSIHTLLQILSQTVQCTNNAFVCVSWVVWQCKSNNILVIHSICVEILVGISSCLFFLYAVGLKIPLSSYRASVWRTLYQYSSFITRKRKKRTEKSIRQRNRINIPHTRILRKIRINKKENRHIHGLARIQLLLLKAKTLNLTKIGGYLCRRNAVGCDTNDIVGPFVCGCIEC